MSLVGNLEDLGLGDILQIVSLSRKSGVLVLNSREREGEIVFLHGQVIRATSSQIRENLGDLLLRKGLVSLENLKKALFIQRNSDRSPRLGTILAEKFDLPQAKIEAAVKEQIEKIVFSFFDWTAGGFSFEVGEPEEVATTSFSPLQFMLDQGLNPQWLAMEGSRILDEMRHRGESFVDTCGEPAADFESLPGIPLPVQPPARAAAANGEAEPRAMEPVPTPAETEPAEPAPAPVESAAPPLLVADDDQQTGQVLCGRLREQGLAASAYTSGRGFLQAVARVVAAGQQPLLIIDLIMPRLDGSGILGGLELLAQVRRRFPYLAVMMMTDHPNAEAAERARRLGIEEVLVKPRHGELQGERGRHLLTLLGDAVAARAGLGARPAATDAGSKVNFGAELLREIGVEAPVERLEENSATPGLHLLRGMLQELHNPTLGGGIILLVLRFASEVMNRAVVFSVKDDQVVGLGQFGLEISGESADARVRKIAIPLRDESVFRRVAAEMMPLRIRPGNSSWDAYLQKQLGGGRPEEVFLGPILSEGKVVAVLYGDNHPAPEPIGDTESLEIFLSQAGLAMEKALLERRLRSREEQ
jgi:CheY-like chemotaxis protein